MSGDSAAIEPSVSPPEFRTPACTMPARFGPVSGQTLIALLLAAYAVIGHVVNWRSAGALWRDEQNLAVFGTFTGSELIRMLPFDSSGPICHFAIKLLAMAGVVSDGSLRTVGLAIGLSLLAATWAVVWSLVRTPPVLTLGLIATSGSLIRYGDSIRAYGLGATLGLLTWFAFARLTIRPTSRHAAVALVVALVALHTLYANAVLILAASVAAALADRTRRAAVASLSCGAACAVSLLIELPIFRSVSRYIASHGQRAGAVEMLQAAADFFAIGPLGAALYAAVLLTVVAVSVRSQSGPREDAPAIRRFAVVSLAIIVVAFPLYLRGSGFNAFPWHLVAPLYLSAVLGDVLLGTVNLGPRLAVVTTTMLLVFVSAAQAGSPMLVAVRRPATNADALCRALERKAAPDDLVLVAPWERAVSVRRYFSAAAPWEPVPPLSDVRVHRHDLVTDLLRRMEQSPPADSIPPQVRGQIDRVRKTIRAGRRVWWLGAWLHPGFPRPPSSPSMSTPPWFEDPYRQYWFAQIYQAVVEEGGTWSVVPVREAENADWPEDDALSCGRLPGVPLAAPESR